MGTTIARNPGWVRAEDADRLVREAILRRKKVAFALQHDDHYVSFWYNGVAVFTRIDSSYPGVVAYPHFGRVSEDDRDRFFKLVREREDARRRCRDEMFHRLSVVLAAEFSHVESRAFDSCEVNPRGWAKGLADEIFVQVESYVRHIPK